MWRSHQAADKNTTTMASCPSSTPTLNPPSATASACVGRPRSSNTLAKPKPWISPNTNASRHRFSENQPSKLFSAASTTDSAITGSTTLAGGSTHFMTDSPRVMECATVKAVTTDNTSANARPKRSTGCQVTTARRADASGASTSRLSKNKMWSMPIQMCHTPSTT